jgi:hypothetical protein
MLKATVFILVVLTGFSSSVVFAQSEKEDSLYLYNRGEYWYGDHTHKGLDTLRLYVERHPYATTPPGETLGAISETIGFTGNLHAAGKNDWIEEYNWLVKIQPLNSERSYLSEVITSLAYTLKPFDRNEAANMWYNFSLIFDDSADVAFAWDNIKQIRKFQKLIPEDSTPFHVLTFPLAPLAGVKPQHKTTSSNIELSLVPNPATTSSYINVELPKSKYLTISLYDLLGRRIRQIASDYFEAGSHSLSFDVHDLSPGSYYIRLECPTGVITKSVIIQH